MEAFEVAETWVRSRLAERLARIQPKTARAEREPARQLKQYFGSTRVARISADEVLSYIAARKEAGMANGTINRNTV